MRTEGDFIKINEWLLPLSWLYGLGVQLRNLLFDTGILKSKSYSTPVISVGNITVGGSGKTPHVEYLIRLLQNHTQVAVLSRGYKRKTRGYRLSDAHSTMSEIGDEPFQMKHKFPKAYVAVDAKRTRGIEHLIGDRATSDVGAILLDDAFQHRYVKPGVNILLVDYHRLIMYDKLLPAGRLREPASGKSRADIVIVTKCPKDLKPMEFRVLTKAMALYPFQELYFTTIVYDRLQGLFTGHTMELTELADKRVLLLTGIASPKQIMTDIAPLCTGIVPITYGDHHAFTQADITRINELYACTEGNRIILTTEKDATRLMERDGLSPEAKEHIYTLPIHVTFMQGQGDKFNHKILGYIRKNSRSYKQVKTKGEHKPKGTKQGVAKPHTISFKDNI